MGTSPLTWEVELERLVEKLPPEDTAQAIGALEAAKAKLWARLVMPSQDGASEDRLLDVNEAAGLLGVSRDHLYRHAESYPFTVREGRRLRFSSLGIQEYLSEKRLDSQTARSL